MDPIYIAGAALVAAVTWAWAWARRENRRARERSQGRWEARWKEQTTAPSRERYGAEPLGLLDPAPVGPLDLGAFDGEFEDEWPEGAVRASKAVAS